MDVGVNFSVTVGAASSSVIVSGSETGSAMPDGPLTVPETVTCLSGASTSLLEAVTVTEPVLSVSPAVIVSSRLELSSKSPATAGDTAGAETVTWTC